MRFSYKTRNVCAGEISFDYDGKVVSNIRFLGGCNGNLKAIAKLVDGWTVEQIQEKLSGNTCGMRTTSCADQLAVAVGEAKEKFENMN
ncbi:MAG: TIGR03905 family TSCPD domain-containing protein [Clostridia bacterium]|nr:TIGR03905 family TSCPD domain-containing protein [Clostridia bacterium]